jgi:flagellar biosynthesis regulator FlbT
MNKLQQILENFPDEGFIIVDGYDNAVIGVDTNSTPMRLVYSVSEMIQCLIDEGMTEDDAIDHYEYNTVRSLPYVENAPILVNTDFF